MHAAGAGEVAAIRGPHARLAVRLQQRDRGRDFVLGQRIQYVLLPGARLQVQYQLVRCIRCSGQTHRSICAPCPFHVMGVDAHPETCCSSTTVFTWARHLKRQGQLPAMRTPEVAYGDTVSWAVRMKLARTPWWLSRRGPWVMASSSGRTRCCGRCKSYLLHA